MSASAQARVAIKAPAAAVSSSRSKTAPDAPQERPVEIQEQLAGAVRLGHRFALGPDGGLIQRAPQPPAAEAPAKTAISRIELYVAENRMIVHVEGRDAPLVFNITEIDTKTLQPGGKYQLTFYGPGRYIQYGGQSVIRWSGFPADEQAWSALAGAGKIETELVVHSSGGEGPAPDNAREKSQAGREAAPDRSAKALTDDPGFAEGNPQLAQLYLDFLGRYAKAAPSKVDARLGLTSEQVRQLSGQRPEAQVMTRYFAQGWREFTASGGNDVLAFGLLEEALLDQWSRGNDNVLENRLAVSKDSSGFGIFLRGTGQKYYDEAGMPISANGPGYHDRYYRVIAPPFNFKIKVQDEGAVQVFQAAHQAGIEDPAAVYLAAKAYVDNLELIVPAVKQSLGSRREEVEKKLQDQFENIVKFLGGHVVAMFLKLFPATLELGLAIDLLLKVYGYFLELQFTGHMLALALKAGQELSHVHRDPKAKALDALSEKHLARAIPDITELVVELIALGLTKMTMKTFQATIDSLPPIQPGGPEPLPATAGGSGEAPGPSASVLEGGPGSSGKIPWGPVLSQGSGTGGNASEGNREKGEEAKKGPAKERSRQAEDLPREPELPDKKASLEDRLAYLERNRSLLGAGQRQKLDDFKRDLKNIAPEDRARRAKELENWEKTVERGLKGGFAQALSQFLKFPVLKISRVANTDAGDWEKINNALRTGRPMQLTIESRTADGEPVQIDGYFDPNERAVYEYKDIDADSLRERLGEPRGQERIRDYQIQMEKQGRFARDWNLEKYVWDVPPDAVDLINQEVRSRISKAAANKIEVRQGFPNSSGQ